MLTLHRKRRIGGTVVIDRTPHDRHYRACNADRFEDDGMNAARGLVNGLVIGLACWALLALGVWALSFLWSN